MNKNTPQLLLENQLCFPLYAAARRVVSLYTPYFKEYGLTYTQYIVLLALWEKDQVSVGDLCGRLYLDSGTLTPLLKKMEKECLVTRTRSTEDERVVLIALTEKATALKERVALIPGQIGSCVPLSAEEAYTLHRLLYKILDS